MQWRQIETGKDTLERLEIVTTDRWLLCNEIAAPPRRHPHLSPLPSRERELGSQWHTILGLPRPDKSGLAMTRRSVLSSLSLWSLWGLAGLPRRRDVTLTLILSRRGRGNWGGNDNMRFVEFVEFVEFVAFGEVATSRQVGTRNDKKEKGFEPRPQSMTAGRQRASALHPAPSG